MAQLINEVFIRPPIYETLLSGFNALELMRASSLNRRAREAVQDFMRRAFNINKRLLPFFNDPLAFRSLQARTAMIISGSFALQFFDRTHYPDSDIDLYVHPDQRIVLEVASFLEENGYKYVPLRWQETKFSAEVQRVFSLAERQTEEDDEYDQLYGMPSLRAVYTFERQRSIGGSDTQKVQIVVSQTSPLASVLDFHSTCVMNVITYNTAYSLYPRATFEGREALVTNDKNPQAKKALVKYAERGWRVVANPSPLVQFLNSAYYHLDTIRWVCDSQSWTIRLDTEGVTSPPRLSPSSVQLDWDPVAECSWMLSLRRRNSQVTVYYEVLHTTILRWQYTAGCFPYWHVLLQFFVNQGKLEHLKIPSGKSRDDVLQAWTWWDHELPNFRKRYQEYFPSVLWDQLAGDTY